jgi:hypothetical protein
MNQHQYYQISCKQCRKSHRKCDRRLPSCTACDYRNQSCTYAPPKKRQRSNHPYDEDDSTCVGVNNIVVPTDLTLLESSNLNQSTNDSLKVNRKNVCDKQLDDVEKVPLNNVLDLCFKFVMNKNINVGVEELQKMIASSLCNVSPCPSAEISSNLEDYESRINRALFYSAHAVILLHSPVFSSSNNAPIQEKEQIRLHYIANESILNDSSYVIEIAKKFSRAELRKTADDMFKSARAILLGPDIYPYLPIKPKLAHTCANLVNYLLSRRTNIGEARLYLGAIKEFLKNAKSKMNAHINLNNAADRRHLENIKQTTDALVGKYYGLKMLITLNFDYKECDSYAKLIQIIDLAMKAYEGVATGLNHKTVQDDLAKIEVFRRVLLDEPEGLPRLNKFLATLRNVITDINWIPAEEQKANSSVFYVVNGLFQQLFAANIEASKTNYDPETTTTIKRIRLEIANYATKYCLENLQIFLIGGVLYFELCHHICKIHASFAKECLLNKFIMEDTLSDILYFIQTDIYILNMIYEKYETPEASIISKELKVLVREIIARIDSLKKNKLKREASRSSNQLIAPIVNSSSIYLNGRETSHPIPVQNNRQEDVDIHPTNIYRTQYAPSTSQVAYQQLPHYSEQQYQPNTSDAFEYHRTRQAPLIQVQQHQQLQQQTFFSQPTMQAQTQNRYNIATQFDSSNTLINPGDHIQYIPNFDSLDNILVSSEYLQDIFSGSESDIQNDNFLF